MAAPRLVLIVLAALAAALVVGAAPSRAGEPPPQPPTQLEVRCPPLPEGALVQPRLALQILPASQAQCAPLPAAAPEVATAGVDEPAGFAGTVTEEGSGAPLAGACVIAINPMGDIAASATTDAAGAYDLSHRLQRGRYRVWFVNCAAPGSHLSEWYGGGTDVFSAGVLELWLRGTVTGIDAALTPGGGEINGTVTEEGTGAPLADICVVAFDASLRPAGYGTTAADGTYRVAGLPAGEHIVYFNHCASPQQHVPEYYDDQAHWSLADAVGVPPDAKVGGIDASLARGASVNGTVSTPPFPAPGICVAAYDASGFFRGLGITDSDGRYTIGGLENGPHYLFFFDCASPLHYVPEWYDDRSSFETATAVNIGAPGSKRSGIDANIVVGGSIYGEALQAGVVAPLRLVCIQAWALDGNLAGTAASGLDGTYELGGVRAGTYKVRFWDCRENPSLVSVWEGQMPNFESALPVNVPPAGTEVSTAIMSPGGLLNGTVRAAASNRPLPVACVQAYDGAGELHEFTGASESGEYLMVLPAGQFRIFFFDCSGDRRYSPQWYFNDQFFEDANPVSITVGTKRSNLNASLTLALLGDVDCDGRRTSLDAALILQGVAALIDVFPCHFNSDVDGDGFYGPTDAALVLQFVAGLLSDL